MLLLTSVRTVSDEFQAYPHAAKLLRRSKSAHCFAIAGLSGQSSTKIGPERAASSRTANLLKIARCSRLLRCFIAAIIHSCRKYEMSAQMGNVLKEQDFMSECDVVEQNKMLM